MFYETDSAHLDICRGEGCGGRQAGEGEVAQRAVHRLRVVGRGPLDGTVPALSPEF